MTDFLFALHEGATLQQESIVSDGLEARFPGHKFIASGADEGLEDAIVPVVGTPHPTEPDAVVMIMPPDSLVGEVREAFAELLAVAWFAKPS
jgi:hypothetical protein